jgi:catechol 2,3-dioxygenase-like lactoylglutathione lyase family enzyme
MDIDASLAFYLGTLGAVLQWRDRDGPGPAYVALRWREHELHLSSHAGDGATGSVAVVAVPNVEVVFDALCRTGWRPPSDRGPVFRSPTDQTWGTRELYVADPDANVVRFVAPAPPPAREPA